MSCVTSVEAVAVQPFASVRQYGIASRLADQGHIVLSRHGAQWPAEGEATTRARAGAEGYGGPGAGQWPIAGQANLRFVIDCQCEGS